MNHQVPDELISAYFDGEVTPDERSQVETLLESSTELRQQLDDASKLSALLHSFPREVAPQTLATNVQNQVDVAVLTTPRPTQQKRPGLRREWTAFGAGIMATMASLFLFVAVNRPQPVSEHEKTEGLADSKAHGEKLSESLVAENESKWAAVTGRGSLNLVTPIDDVPSAPSAGMAAFNTPTFTTMTTNGSEGQQWNDGNGNLFSEAFALQPASPVEFLESLKNGEVGERVVWHVSDPSNTVAVVELTVVDIERGAEEMKMILQKRSVPQVERGEARASVESNRAVADAPARKLNKKSSASDEMLVFFVRASGPQLADTISETKGHPDVYLGWMPQLPIDLRLNAVANSTDLAIRESAKNVGDSTESSEYKESAGDQQTVAVEANLAVNNYAGLNGLALEDPLNVTEPLKQNSTVAAGVNAKKDGSVTSSARSFKADEPRSSPNIPALRYAEGNSNQSNQEIKNVSQGYATFRVALDNQRQPVQQQLPQAQNSAVVYQGTQSNFGNSFPFAMNNNRQRYNRPNSDLRDPRVVRMLIVLKAEQSGVPPAQ